MCVCVKIREQKVGDFEEATLFPFIKKIHHMTHLASTLSSSSSVVLTRVVDTPERRRRRNTTNTNIIRALGGFGPEIKPEEIRKIQEARRKKIEQAKRDAEARKKGNNNNTTKKTKNTEEETKPKKFFGLF